MSSKSPLEMFGTDPTLETGGITVDYGPFWFRVARAGGGNSRFREIVRSKLAPYQRAIELGEMDDKIAQRLSGEAFAEAVVLGWGRRETDEATGKVTELDGQMIVNGKSQKFSVEACKACFAEAPGLLDDLMVQAQKPSNFRHSAAVLDAKN